MKRRAAIAAIFLTLSALGVAAAALASDTPPSGPTSTDIPTVPTSSPQTVTVDSGGTAGNNAATQIAVVTPTANSLAVAIQNVTVNCGQTCPTTVININVANASSLNLTEITQIITQICVNCTVVLQQAPPPPVVVAAAAPAQPAPSLPARQGYCMPHPIMRADGTMGVFVDLVAGQPDSDPRYAGAVPAHFDAANGYSCPSADVGVAGVESSAMTLTLPASFAGAILKICVQATVASQPPTCQTVVVGSGTSISIPLTTNMPTVSVTPIKANKPAKPAKPAKPKKKKKKANAS